jgi:hypothetical protein
MIENLADGSMLSDQSQHFESPYREPKRVKKCSFIAQGESWSLWSASRILKT